MWSSDRFTIVALAAALLVGCGFQREQRLVAVYHIQRPELALEMRLQLFEPQIGHAFGAYSVWAGFAATRRRRICCTMSLCMSR